MGMKNKEELPMENANKNRRGGRKRGEEKNNKQSGRGKKGEVKEEG